MALDGGGKYAKKKKKALISCYEGGQLRGAETAFSSERTQEAPKGKNGLTFLLRRSTSRTEKRSAMLPITRIEKRSASREKEKRFHPHERSETSETRRERKGM